jgi:ABC-type multidrug transport system ATPase subunit
MLEVQQLTKLYGHRLAVDGVSFKVNAFIQKIERLLKVCLLNPYKHSPIASYSKGMKQKVMMLAALPHDADVLVL